MSINVNGGWYNYFGMGTSIFTLPLVWIGNHIYKATTQLSIHAGGLWSHCVVLPLLIAAFYYLFANNGKRAWIATIFLSFAYITRPTMALPLIVTTGYIYINHREQFWRTIITGLLILLTFGGISKYSYGTFLPRYYLDTEYQAGTRGLKYAAAKGLAVVVMEPLRGGRLTKELPEAVKKLCEKAPLERTPADRAL